MTPEENRPKIQVDFWFLMGALFLMPIAGIFDLAGKPVQISDVLFSVYFLFWLSRKFIIRDFQIDSRFYFFISLFVVFFLSAFFSSFPKISLVGLAIKIYLLTLAYVISQEVNSVFKLKAAINTILLSGIYVIILSFWGMGLFAFRLPGIFLCPADMLDLPLRFLPRVQSTFSSPSFLSSFLSVIILFLLGKAIFREQQFRKKSFPLYYIYIALAAAVFIFTFSRDLIGLGWGLVFFFQGRSIKKKITKVILRCSAAAMVLLSLFVLFSAVWYIFPVKIYKAARNIPLPEEALQYKLDAGSIVAEKGWVSEKIVSYNAKLHNRAVELKDAALTFARNPVLGIGAGVLPSQGYFPRPYSRSSHNTYFQVLAQTGILGFAVFLAFIISLFRILSARKHDCRLYPFRIIFKFTLIVLLINMLFTDLDNFRYFWIISGLILAFNNPGIKNVKE